MFEFRVDGCARRQVIAREVESGNDCLWVGRGHTLADEFDELEAEEGEMKRIVEIEYLKESCQQLERRKGCNMYELC